MVLVVDLLRYWLHRAAHENDIAVAAARGAPLGRPAVLAEHRALPPDREGAADVPRQPAVPADGRRRDGARALLPRLRDQRLLPALQRQTALRRRSTTSSAAPRRTAGTTRGCRAKSNANYGNTVIIWDLLFGTWFLPTDRDVRDLGLQDRAYPAVVPRPDARAVPAMSRRCASLAAATRDAMRRAPRYWRPVERLADAPGRAQAERPAAHPARESRHALRSRSTASPTSRTADAFASRVPVQDYETLRPYIDEQRRTGAPALTSEAPLFYAQTSGTTGTPEVHPDHADGARACTATSRRSSRTCSTAPARRRSTGKALGIMGAAVEGHLDTGHAVGSVSGHLYESLPRAVRSRFVVPPEVSSDRRLRAEIPGHPAARAGPAGRHATSARRTRPRSCGC